MEMGEGGDGRVFTGRAAGVLKKKKKMHELEQVRELPPPPLPQIIPPRFGVLKKKKKKAIPEMEEAEEDFAFRALSPLPLPPPPAPPLRVAGVLKKKKVNRPVQLQSFVRGAEFEGEGIHVEHPVAAIVPSKLVKQEPRIKGVLKRKAIIPREQQGQGTPHTSSPPADPPHVTTEQPKVGDKRKAMIKELAAFYRNECQSYCRQLLTLQRQWRQPELQGVKRISVPSQAPADVEQPPPVPPVPKQEPQQKVGTSDARKPLKTKPKAAPSIAEVKKEKETLLPVVPAKIPLRRRVGWTASERDSVRRGLMMFGLGRSEKIRSSMRSMRKLSRHGLGDIADSSWEFVRCCALLAEPKEKQYAENRLQDAKEHGIEMGPEVSERVGEFDKMEKNATVWLKRLKLLDNLADVVRICANKETRDAAYRAIDLLRDASIPTPWWGRDADLALLSGVYKHGFGNYDSLRSDEQFAEAFKPAFRPVVEQADAGTDEDTDLQLISREKPDWPEANTLTRRLKRLVDHVQRVGHQVGKIPKAADTGQIARSQKWSKRDKMEFLRLLMRWGLPLVQGRSKVRWQFFTEKSTTVSLKKRSDASLEACYRDIYREMKQILDHPDSQLELAAEKPNLKKKRNASTKKVTVKSPNSNVLEQSAFSTTVSQVPVGPPILNDSSAMRLKERLELLDTLQQVPESIEDEEWSMLGLSLHHSHDMPSWWKAGVHDDGLVKGVLKHGFGFWDDIFADTSLGFPDAIGVQGADGGVVPYPKPTPKACLKRVKFIANNLRRQLRKVKVIQPRRKRPAPEGKEPKELKEPKRFKYARAVEVPRDAESRPILPLVLTDRLSLVDLGTVEPDRPGFHTERHIFPIGFTTLRDHASTIDRNGRTLYTCTIIDGGGPGPLFRVTPADNPEMVIEKDSASGAWVVVCAAVNKVRGIDREKVTVSGTEMFGLSHPEVCRLIQELPRADLCRNFRPELSFSRFGPHVVSRTTGADANSNPGAQDAEREKIRPLSSDFETDEAGSGRDEIPLAQRHVRPRETKGKGLLRPPNLQEYLHEPVDIGAEEEEEEEEEEEGEGEGEGEEDEETEEGD